MIGYCIGAYVRPGQTARLVRRLLHDDPAGQVVLHFDQRQASFDPGEVAGPRVTLVPERPVHWGGFDQVQLSIDMMRIATEQLHCSYVVMLSGQDYPLCHVGGLEGELAHFDVWAEIRPLVRDGEVMWPEAMRRYSYRWWCLSEPGRLLLALDYHVAAKIPGVHWSTRAPPLPRVVHYHQRGQLWWGARLRAGLGLPIYTGSSWTSLSARAVATVLSAPGPVMSFFRHVPVADEACFHTILGNAAGLTLAPGNARFIKWDHNDSPEILTSSDLEAMFASGAHFARKFDDEVDATILDRLDERLDSTRAPDTGRPAARGHRPSRRPTAALRLRWPGRRRSPEA